MDQMGAPAYRGIAEAPVGSERTNVLALNERALWERHAELGEPWTRGALVERFLPLARSIARRYENLGEPIEDLNQVASLALINAVDRFDTSRGYAFTSFAVPTIVGELKRHFRDRSWAVRPPRSLQELSLRVDRTTRSLTKQLDRPPTVPEIARALGRDEEHILEALRARVGRSALSLQAPRGAEMESALEDECGREDDGYHRAESRALLERLMTLLPARDREVMRRRFGADMTQAEIGAVLGISQMQVTAPAQGDRPPQRDRASAEATAAGPPLGVERRGLPSAGAATTAGRRAVAREPRDHGPPCVSYALGAHHPELLLERVHDVDEQVVADVVEFAALLHRLARQRDGLGQHSGEVVDDERVLERPYGLGRVERRVLGDRRHAPVGRDAEHHRPLGDAVAQRPPCIHELVELKVQRTEMESLDVPVQLLADQRKVGELHQRALEDHAERMALLVAKRRVSILHDEFGRHAAAPAIA
jgi:RNA polymerase sigma-B factor